jgi:nucleoside-diphosphate-sugar epimerase
MARMTSCSARDSYSAASVLDGRSCQWAPVVFSGRGDTPELARGIRLAVEHPAVSGEVFNLCEVQCAPLRLWIQHITAAAGSDMELVRVPDDALPDDLEITGDIAQHWLTSPAKAGEVLGWTHRDAGECVRESVEWHMAHSSYADNDFAADDRALATAATP